MNSTIELQIILGFNCNFACKHCLNSSKPNYNQFDISEEEMLLLSNIINENENIRHVSFNGGEPLLYLKQIKKIKKNVVRKISWSITTNGSRIHENISTLSEIGIDSAIVSYDKYHQSFQAEKVFEDSILSLKTIVPNVEVNVVYENLADLTPILTLCEKLSIPVVPTQLIASGRAKEFETKNNGSPQITCPNISLSRTKITYLPTRGFTVCCGPLLFDKNLNNKSFFSQSIENTYSSFNFKVFNQISVYGKILKELSVDTAGDNCASCTHTLSSAVTFKFSDENINRLNKKFIPCGEYLDKEDEKKLSETFHVKYLFRLDPREVKNNYHEIRQEKIKIEKIIHPTPEQIVQFREFTIKSFYEKYDYEYNENDVNEFVSVIPTFFSGETETYFFIKDQALVAVLTLYRYATHPFFSVECYHIGYWGYDKFLVSKEEAQFIKLSWRRILEGVALSKNIPVAGIIDYFNTSVKKMIKAFGFELKALRLDKKP